MSMLGATGLATVLVGMLVGLVLGIIGGGGSVLAVPLLVYGVGVASPHVAIGTSSIAVSASALANLVAHWRAGNVSWRCAGVFSIAGVLGAFLGSSFAKMVNGQSLLALFGLLMIVIGASMFRRPRGREDADVRLTSATAGRLLPALTGMGLGVGLLSGFFGIGGGFLIVPALMAATRMPISRAVGTSLVSVTVFGATTATNYAISGLIDWPMAAVFISGGVIGGAVGIAMGKRLSKKKGALRLVFATTVVAVGLYVSSRGVSVWLGS